MGQIKGPGMYDGGFISFGKINQQRDRAEGKDRNKDSFRVTVHVKGSGAEKSNNLWDLVDIIIKKWNPVWGKTDVPEYGRERSDSIIFQFGAKQGMNKERFLDEVCKWIHEDEIKAKVSLTPEMLPPFQFKCPKGGASVADYRLGSVTSFGM